MYPSPAPPYSSGKMTPSSPISASFGIISIGKCEASSHSITWGAISPSANSRTLRRSCCCSSVSWKFKRASLSAQSYGYSRPKIILYEGRARKHRRPGPVSQAKVARRSGSGSFAARPAGHLAKDPERAFDAFGIHVAVGHEADGKGGRIQRPDAVRLQGFAKFDGVETGFPAVENDNVGLDLGRIDTEAGDFGNALCQAAGVLVVDREAPGRLLQGD